MSNIRIDRLTLRNPGGYPAEPLARRIGELLAVSGVPRQSGSIGAIQLRLADAGGDADEMARRIVEGLLRELSRSL